MNNELVADLSVSMCVLLVMVFSLLSKTIKSLCTIREICDGPTSCLAITE